MWAWDCPLQLPQLDTQICCVRSPPKIGVRRAFAHRNVSATIYAAWGRWEWCVCVPG